MAFGWMTTDGATVRISHNGRADVFTSAASHGQSLETTIAQVVADELGLEIDARARACRATPTRRRSAPARVGAAAR